MIEVETRCVPEISIFGAANLKRCAAGPDVDTFGTNANPGFYVETGKVHVSRCLRDHLSDQAARKQQSVIGLACGPALGSSGGKPSRRILGADYLRVRKAPQMILSIFASEGD